MSRSLRFLIPILALPLICPPVMMGQSAAAGTLESRLFSYLDRDNSRVLEPAEFQKIPLPMRVWLAENGIAADKPLPQEQFLKLAPKMMQAIRSGKHAGREKTPARKVSVAGKSTAARPVSPAPNLAAPASSAGSGTFRANLSLPSSYTAGDFDKDGQIGLYEWKKWKSTAFLEFMKLDRNDDGFLTPRELQSAGSPGSISTASSATSSSLTSTRPSTSPTTTTGTGSSGSSASASTASVTAVGNDEARQTAVKFFDYMDGKGNKNGTVEPDEWANGGSRIRPTVEKGGADLTKPLTKDEVIAAYIKGVAAAE